MQEDEQDAQNQYASNELSVIHNEQEINNHFDNGQFQNHPDKEDPGQNRHLLELSP